MTAVTQMRDIWHCYFMNLKYQCIAHSWYVCSILEYSDHTAVFSGLQVSIGLYMGRLRGMCLCPCPPPKVLLVPLSTIAALAMTMRGRDPAGGSRTRRSGTLSAVSACPSVIFRDGNRSRWIPLISDRTV